MRKITRHIVVCYTLDEACLLVATMKLEAIWQKAKVSIPQMKSMTILTLMRLNRVC